MSVKNRFQKVQGVLLLVGVIITGPISSADSPRSGEAQSPDPGPNAHVFDSSMSMKNIEDSPRPGKAPIPDFGPNVHVFDPSMSMKTIQKTVDTAFDDLEHAQFGSERCAFLFKPGDYNLDVNVGFYTEVLGLGESPDDTHITGAVRAEADWMKGNATCTFWRSCAGLAVTPTYSDKTTQRGDNRWSVSQAAPFRRMHIRGNLLLTDNGWASGGFIADSVVDGWVDPLGQQQWLSRNSD